mgnify:FL=1
MRFSVITAASRSIRGLSQLLPGHWPVQESLALQIRYRIKGDCSWNQMYIIVIKCYRLSQIVDVVFLELQFSLSLGPPSCNQLSVAFKHALTSAHQEVDGEFSSHGDTNRKYPLILASINISYVAR